MNDKNKIDMLQGPMAYNLFRMALPIILISILQQLFNAADVAVVGKFASDQALAAVGANTTIINMFLTLFTGLATGGNVAISTLIGQGKKEKIHSAVQTVFSLALICAVIVIIIGELIAAPLLRLMNTPANILGQAELYLRLYLFALAFAVIYNFASAILRSKGDTKRPLYCLIASGVINVLLNLFFVIVMKMDVAGVALATVISNILCAGATVFLLMKEDSDIRLRLTELMLQKDSLLFTLRIGLPAGIQGMFFSISNMVIQSGINSFGAECIAGNTTAMNFEFIAYFVVMGFGQTATTYTSQNYGAGKTDRCKKIYLLSMVMGFGLCLTVSLFFFSTAAFWFSLFTSSEAVFDYAMIRMKYVVLLECLTVFNEISGAGMRGIGISMTPTVISIMGSCIFRIIWVNTAFVAFHSIIGLMAVYPVSWLLLTLVSVPVYLLLRRGKYAEISA